MNFITGKDGTITYDGVQLAKVGSWQLSAQVEPLDVTSLGDSARDYVPGIKSGSGSCSVWYYQDAPVPLLSKVVRTDAPQESDKVTMRLGFGDNSMTFICLITNAELSMSVGVVLQAQIQFQVCGDMTGVDL